MERTLEHQLSTAVFCVGVLRNLILGKLPDEFLRFFRRKIENGLAPYALYRARVIRFVILWVFIQLQQWLTRIRIAQLHSDITVPYPRRCKGRRKPDQP